LGQGGSDRARHRGQGRDRSTREVRERPLTPIRYASTDAGLELPIVDVTHPAFRVDPSDAELDAMSREFIADAEKRAKIPRFAQRLMFGTLLRRSVLGRGIMGAHGTFLDGLSTYLLKLGPANLDPRWATAIDRKIAASLPALSVRLRLQDMARLLADGLTASLGARPTAPLCLVNIAGGPAIDSVNALLVLQARDPSLLSRRHTAIVVFDQDAHGPSFGARALAELRGNAGPLADLDITFERVAYDWRQTSVLTADLARRDLDQAVVAVSSEGGLFEYGLDEEIAANLATLAAATPPATFVVGSVTRLGGPAIYLHRELSRAAVRPRALETFREIAARGGWDVSIAIERPFSVNVRLDRSNGSNRSERSDGSDRSEPKAESRKPRAQSPEPRAESPVECL
jgi:hypothetical protein